jgi:alkyl sulfatase BDS1-like metallo-beta-lactamase superfamily hydrolase
VYTPRGAQIRDALAWSKYIHESIDLFAGETDIVFMSHHWPRFGTESVIEFMAEQRDAYRWIHDQTMRRANHGETPLEIAEALGPPPGLDDRFHVRGYYGTLSHNAKAVYQRYLGWFDANPAHLHSLPPVDAARKYVEFMGGADAVIEKAQGSIAAGEYRWAAEVLNHVVFAEPDHREAQLLQADVLEQLGYRAESGPWRDFYLTGANELRHGAPHLGGSMASSLDVLRAMTTEMLVDLMGVRLNGDRVGTSEVTINLTVTDDDQRGAIGVRHGALHFTPGRHVPDAAVTLAVTHLGLARLASGLVAPAELGVEDLAVTGAADALDRFLGWLDTFDASFAIVTAD